MNATAMSAAQAALRNEVIDDPDFVVLALEFDDILNGIELIGRHNLNSTDAAILQAYLRYATPMRPWWLVYWSHLTNACCRRESRGS